MWEHGGFPEPFLRRDQTLHSALAIFAAGTTCREKICAKWRISELGTMETLMQLLAERSAQQLVYSNLAREIQVAVDTVRRWVDLLSRMHYGFMVRPWFANVAKALRKEPKWFQRDWSGWRTRDAGRKPLSRAIC